MASQNKPLPSKLSNPHLVQKRVQLDRQEVLKCFDKSLPVNITKAATPEGSAKSPELNTRQLDTFQYPMSTVGIIYVVINGVNTRVSTAVLVGPDIVVTSNHLVPWEQIPESGLLFIPDWDPNSASGDPPEPYGSSWISQVYGYGNSAAPYDLYLCHLEEPLGRDRTGWPGVLAYHDDNQYLTPNPMDCLVLGYTLDSTNPLQAGNLNWDPHRIVTGVQDAGDFKMLDMGVLPREFPIGAVAWTVYTDGWPYIVGVWSGAETGDGGNVFGSVFTGGPGFVSMVQWAWQNWG